MNILKVVSGVAAGIVLVLALYALGTGAQNAVERRNFTIGYCAALHGTVLTDDVCNVNGKVVEVPND